MKLTIPITMMLIIAASVVRAQTADELKAQMTALDQQIALLHQALLQSPDFQKLQKDVRDATKAYDDTVSKDNKISELDKKIAALREQTRDLTTQRGEREKTLAAGSLAKKKAAREEAEKKLNDADRRRSWQGNGTAPGACAKAWRD